MCADIFIILGTYLNARAIVCMRAHATIATLLPSLVLMHYGYRCSTEVSTNPKLIDQRSHARAFGMRRRGKKKIRETHGNGSNSNLFHYLLLQNPNEP